MAVALGPTAWSRSAPGAVSLLLAGAMCVLPFLIPYHQDPLRSFYPEWFAAALGLCAVAVALAGRVFPSVRLPAPGRWLIGFAVFLAACALARDPVYPQMTLWAIAYVAYAVLMLWLGAHLVHEMGLARTAEVLAACVLAGALANAAAGVVQFYGRPFWLEDLVAHLRGNRAYGNIAQANLYANYLALGQAALLFLWVRGRIGGSLTWCAAALLVWASALSDSRAALLFVLWFAALGALSTRQSPAGDMRRLRTASFVLAAATLAAFAVVPRFNDLFGLGPAQAGMDGRWFGGAGFLRWPAWALALRLFAGAPIAGVGVGEFAGAAFDAGLPREMADAFEVWTSPHDLVLHLMAETGAIGAALVLAGIAVWCRQVWQSYRAEWQPAAWWIVAAVGVGLVHSLVEFPLWSAHFLGTTALLMGTVTTVSARSLGGLNSGAALRRVAVGGVWVGLAVILALGLRDYGRLDVTRGTGAGSTLAGAAASDDARTLRELGHGVLAPLAEFRLCMGAPLNRDELDLKLRWSARVMHYFPSNAIVGRRAVFLALDGREHEAAALVDRLADQKRASRMQSAQLLQQAQNSDAVIARLIARLQLGPRRLDP
ncbi:MAG: hypothetical protein A3H32_06620 [Betaproteobacteria bacterium RIFCSPLOWO2_02_FULL_63_19]|nr:MAG: hypothetical protein A3H32_06620 [Betaproteobacteria bacterium RIFCSPLOWO2_02_FULL_63_19]